MNRKNQDKDTRIWEMLAHKRPPIVSPFFSRNVLREARKTRQKPVWSLSACILAFAAPAAACLMILFLVGRSHAPADFVLAQGDADSVAEIEAIANLDFLVSNEESALWIDPYSL